MTPSELDHLLRIVLANCPGGIAQIEAPNRLTLFIRRTSEVTGSVLDPGWYKTMVPHEEMWHWKNIGSLANEGYVPTPTEKEKPRLDPDEFEERTV